MLHPWLLESARRLSRLSGWAGCVFRSFGAPFLRLAASGALSPSQPALFCSQLSCPQGAWRRQPYDEIEVEEIESFVVAEDCGEERDAAALPNKLLTGLAPDSAAAAGGCQGRGRGRGGDKLLGRGWA